MSDAPRRSGRRLTLARCDGAPPGQHVLVLGGGFLGAHISQALGARGHRVTVLTRSAPSAVLAPALATSRVRLCDLSSMTAVEGLIGDVQHVVYAVGASSPALSQLDPAADVSAVLPPLVRLLDLIRLNPAVNLVYLSSGGAIYGNATTPVVDETAPAHPVSSYGLLKLMAERYIDLYVQQHGVRATVLRIANVYGGGQQWANGQGIVARLLQCLVTGAPFPIFGDGRNIRDYIHVQDVAQVVAQLVANPVPHAVMNVGSGQGHTILDVVRMLETVSGLPVDLTFAAARSFDVRSVVLDISRLREAMPFAPMTLTEGLRQTWQASAPSRIDAPAAKAAAPTSVAAQ